MRGHGRLLPRAWMALAIAALAGCSVFGAARPAADQGRLAVQITDVTTSSHAARLRGTVTNHFSERVDGVRYVVTVRDKSEPPKFTDRSERQVDTVIEAGGEGPLNLNVDGKHFGDKEIRIAIVASPVTLGGRSVPPPDGWSPDD